jgi:2-dehydro-3-deoxygalactonokinase
VIQPARVTARACALIGVDWGTTSARAYRIDAEGAVIEMRAAPLGIQQVRGDFAGALATLLGNWRQESVPRLACGMIGSRQGWIEAPYVECPAAAASLARGIVETPDRALTIVPGLVDRDDEGVPDVMRGEETQIVGAVAGDASPALAVLPGTHSKWAIVRDGAIASFATYMTGEVYAVLREHSILGRMAEMNSQALDPQPSAGAAFARGVRAALADGGAADSLLHRLFGARTLALRADLAPEDTSDYLSGLLIGSEVAAGRGWARRRGLEASSALLVGSPALCIRYAAALHEGGMAAERGPDDAAARGLWRIASTAGLVG